MVVGPLRALGGTPEHAGYELLFYCSQLKDGSISVSYAIPRKDGSYYGARNCPFAGEPGFMNLDSEGYTVAPGMAERILAAMRAGPGAMRSIARGEDPQPCPVTDEQRAEFDDWVRHGYPGEFEDDDG